MIERAYKLLGNVKNVWKVSTVLLKELLLQLCNVIQVSIVKMAQALALSTFVLRDFIVQLVHQSLMLVRQEHFQIVKAWKKGNCANPVLKECSAMDQVLLRQLDLVIRDITALQTHLYQPQIQWNFRVLVVFIVLLDVQLHSPATLAILQILLMLVLV